MTIDDMVAKIRKDFETDLGRPMEMGERQIAKTIASLLYPLSLESLLADTVRRAKQDGWAVGWKAGFTAGINFQTAKIVTETPDAPVPPEL